MIDISDEAAGVLASGSYTLYSRVESWLGSTQLDGDLPVSSGGEDTDVTLNVPETVTLTIPRLYQGVSYGAFGSDIEHPLAAWGQRLHVNVGVGVRGGIEWIRRSWSYIVESRVDGDSVVVTASGLLGLIAEADLISPVTPSGTFTSQLRALVEPALLCDFTAAPPDRSIPALATWDGGRLTAVNEILDAWPATAYVDQDGTLVIVSTADTTTSSLALTDGDGGTTMQWGSDVSRDGGVSVVVARGADATGANVQAAAYDEDPTSPTRYGGPFNPLPQPYIHTSPLLTTTAQCQATARAILARRRARASRKLITDAVPYLALQARDGITVTSVPLGIASVLGVVDQLTMPLTAGDGEMQLGVRIP